MKPKHFLYIYIKNIIFSGLFHFIWKLRKLYCRRGRHELAIQNRLWNICLNFRIDITIWMDYCLDFSTIRLVLAFEMNYLTSLLQIVAAVQLNLLPAQVSIWASFFLFSFLQLTYINYKPYWLHCKRAILIYGARQQDHNVLVLPGVFTQDAFLRFVNNAHLLVSMYSLLIREIDVAHLSF